VTLRGWEELDHLCDLFQQLLGLLAFPWSRKFVRRARWLYVRTALERGMVPKAAYDYAVTMLKGTPAQCGPDMMRKDYEALQKSTIYRPNSKQSSRT
jgi:hypothetical protein